MKCQDIRLIVNMILADLSEPKAFKQVLVVLVPKAKNGKAPLEKMVNR